MPTLKKADIYTRYSYLWTYKLLCSSGMSGQAIFKCGGIYGAAQWDKAIAACDAIINSGIYTLSPNYVENFVQNNEGSKESIWAIPYDHVKFKGII